MARATAYLILSILILMFLGCSQQAQPGIPSHGDLSPATLVDQLPPLPVARTANVLMSFTVQGLQTALRDLNAWDEGTSLRLASSTGTMTWGIWGFANATAASSCMVDFNGSAGSEAYFAISDYARGVWEISGPLPGPQQVFNINDPRYFNPSGDFYIAVITYGGANVLVDQLSLIADVNPVQTEIDNSGGYTSMALVDGNPAISFYDNVDHDLRYVRANDIFGTSWGTALTLDSAGDTGQYTSLKVVDGFPAIAYYDFTAKDLRYIRALDAADSAWGAPVTVDGAGITGEYCSLDVVSGNPAISYYYYDGPALRYVRAADTAGEDDTGAPGERPLPLLARNPQRDAAERGERRSGASRPICRRRAATRMR